MARVWKAPPGPNKAKRIFENFPDLPATEFEESHFRMLVVALSEVYSEWEDIGLCLRIFQKTMKDFRRKWRNQAKKGLISIVDEWMKGNYDEKYLYPCWKSLVYTVANEVGGNNPAAARDIALKWNTYENDPFFGFVNAKEADSSLLHELRDKEQFTKYLYDQYLYEVKSMWFEMGVLLGVPLNKLEDIERENDSSMKRLKAVIKEWIELVNDFDYLPEPTVQILAGVVAHVMGGNNQKLAKKIAEEYHVPSDDGSDPSVEEQKASSPTPPQQVHKQQTAEDQELNPDPAGACATAAGISSGEQEADAAGVQSNKGSAIQIPLAKVIKVSMEDTAADHEKLQNSAQMPLKDCKLLESVLKPLESLPSGRFMHTLLGLEEVHSPQNKLKTAITGEDVHVAIIEQGYNWCHATFGGNATAGAVVPNDGPSIDEVDHGTAVAGTVVGKGFWSKSDYGMYPGGVAPGAKMTVFSGYERNGKSLLGLLQSIDSGCEKFQVIVVSCGGEEPDSATYEATDAITKKLSDEGTVIFAASGNDGDQIPMPFPASLHSVISVASLTTSAKIADKAKESNVDVYCYGEEIIVPYGTNNCLKVCSGSSIATPAVAGLACLAFECARKSGYTGLHRIEKMKAMLNKAMREGGEKHVLRPARFLLDAYADKAYFEKLRI